MAAPARPVRRHLNPKGDPWAAWMHVDISLILAVVALSLVGVVTVYSATRGTDSSAFDTSFMERQAVFVVISAALMAGVTLVPYHQLRPLAPILYWGGILGLLALYTPLGVVRNGTRAWFDFGPLQLQPSEMLKLAYIFMLSSFVGRFDGDLNAMQLAGSLSIGVLPLGLIMLQPDVGTALVFVAITMGILLIGGARAKHIVALTLLGIIGIFVVWNAGVLQTYQQDRLTSFIDPASSQTEAAYQQTQAQIAIGSGGMGGQGFGSGRQTRGDFVPEQHTDFIFTVIGEEFGFLGATAVLGLFSLVVWRCWRTARKAADMFGALICVGVLTMIVFQMFQSIGMTLGIMPITGIPVPFISYGGSSAITSFLAIGMVLNVHMRRHHVTR